MKTVTARRKSSERSFDVRRKKKFMRMT